MTAGQLRWIRVRDPEGQLCRICVNNPEAVADEKRLELC
jgi:hypothetical protein